MEEIKQYIESGILELYAMGELSPAERLEVEEMAALHPSIKHELVEIEKSIEGYATAYAITPSDDMRSKVIDSIQFNKDGSQEAKIIQLQPKKNTGFYKYAFAASVAVLFLSWAALFVIYTKLQDSQLQIVSLQGSNQQFTNRVNYYNKQLETSKTEIGVLRSPDFKFIKLSGTKNAPQASITVAFNKKQKEVMIDMASLKMPENDKQHQYQLWALVDGKPVDLGVFDASTDTTVGMVRMKNLPAGQAFAVTLEPRGGSVSPTMEQMMAMGAI